jgi:hypothetical protein
VINPCLLHDPNGMSLPDDITKTLSKHGGSLCYSMVLHVAPWILFATLGGIMDGKCIYCSDRSAGAPTITVSWTLLPSFYLFFMRSFSSSCCQYLVLDVIPLFNANCHRLRSGRVAEGLFP